MVTPYLIHNLRFKDDNADLIVLAAILPNLFSNSLIVHCPLDTFSQVL